ncbi:MAG: MBL fold metallo-hydrolase [Candidatus Bilamarchaeaceae archaeon]
MLLDCLGACREVGRSAFMLHTDRKILLDYGIKVFDVSGKPKFPTEEIRPDVAVITHAHLDHSGFVPALYKHSKQLRWLATPPTVDICEILWADSMKIMSEELPYAERQYKLALRQWSPITYGQPQSFGNTTIKAIDAGHIAGAAIVEIEHENKRIVYTGDFKLESTHMHKGARTIKDVDILIIESTYADREHPDRSETEKRIIYELHETINAGGSVLFPTFSLGRTQELISVIRKHDKSIPIFLDGMGKELTKIYLRYGGYIRNPDAFKEAVASITTVESVEDRVKAIRTPGAIISSSGMMMGGPVLNYLFNINNRSKIIFTGYNVEGSNGWNLLNKGFIIKDGQQLLVDLPVEYLDLSAHAGRSDLLRFIKEANPEKIILVHGDKPENFAEELRAKGYDAVAPSIGERIEL